MGSANGNRAARAARLLVPAGVAAAVIASGFAFSSAAGADTPPTAPTLTLTAPPQISNDSQVQTLSIKVDNSAASTAELPVTDQIELRLTLPNGLPCNKVQLAEQTGTTLPLVVSGTTPHCVADSLLPAVIPAGQTTTYSYDLTVDGRQNVPPFTGAIDMVAALQQPATTPPAFVDVATSSASTTLVNPSAPSFNGAPPAATVHQDYSYRLVSDPGFAVNTTTWTVYKHVAGGGTTWTTVTSQSVTVGDTTHTVYPLNSPFAFDATTGKVVVLVADQIVSGAAAQAAVDGTNSSPNQTFVIAANNQVDGASAHTDATASSPAVAIHDVDTVPFNVPVLFSDVTRNSQFGSAIYKLADNGIIGGYADGTFRGANTVTRQAFAHFIAEYNDYGTGACTEGDHSGFADVSDNSPFCEDIKSLATQGITTGYAGDTFHPGATISRQAIAAFLYRTHSRNIGVPVTNLGDATCTTPIPFNDVHTTNKFCGDIEWLAANDISNGYNDGGFHPTGGASRQATAQFIFKLGVLENHTY